ncbi:MAG TPA: hypothetical protein PK514_06645 [Spirochaetota bacterium]|nr:hypothetical protein [Spirochaetota bacterium]
MPARILLALILTIFPFTTLFADIIITIDDMVLNGKILEENKKTVTFGNYHGIFIIDLDKIKEIYRTGSYEDDLKILSDKGRVVNKDEVRTNYDSGLKKIREFEIEEDGREPFTYFNLAIAPYIIFNLGKLGTILPCSYGVSLTACIPVSNFEFAKKIFLSGVSIEAGYFYSEKGERGVTGYRASAGPQWQFPVLTGSFKLDWFISAAFGAGWYNVKGLEQEMTAVKWNSGISTGLVFTVSSITISPLLRFDYIYDSKVPLYGMGAALSLGYRF